MADFAPTALTFNGYLNAVGTLAVTQVATASNDVNFFIDPDLTNITPQMLNYAELRIQRDLDLLPAQTSGSYTLAAASNLLQIPLNDFVILRTVNARIGTVLQPLTPVTQEFLGNVYSDTAVTGPPLYFAMFGGDQATGGETTNNVLIGPYADQAYPIIISGTQRLPSLYTQATPTLAASGTTFISSLLPDLLVVASMIYLTGFYQRNAGNAAGNDPQMPMTYETQYGTLLKGAGIEEARKRFAASAWSSMSPPAAATPTR